MDLESMSTELLPEVAETELVTEPWYKKAISLEDAKAFIKTNIVTAARSFIAIGFYLKCVRDQELFKEDEFESVWDFAKEEYGLSKSTASRYMSMNDKFSVDGNSPIIQEEYRLFDKSKLQEMLYLDDEQLREVTPETTVKDIRGMRAPKEIPYIHIPGQVNITDFPEFLPDSYPVMPQLVPQEIGQSQPFTMSVADMLPESSVATSQLTEILPLPLVPIPSKEEKDKIPVFTLENRKSIEGAYGAYRSEMVDAYFEMLSEGLKVLSDEYRDKMLNLSFKTLGNECYAEADDDFMMFYEWEEEWPVMAVSLERLSYEFDQWLEHNHISGGTDEPKMPDSPVEECKEVYTPEYFLEEQKNKLNTFLRVTNGKTLSKSDIEAIERQKIIVSALSAIVLDTDNVDAKPEPEKEPQSQPELPVLKNNDQRAAFINDFETWPLWIETKETEERYYRYELPDESVIVIKVYHSRLFDYHAYGKEYNDRFKDGWGRHEYYLLEPGKHFRDCETNKSYLIEHLKKLQKKGVQES